jgi:hypothetical protein
MKPDRIIAQNNTKSIANLKNCCKLTNPANVYMEYNPREIKLEY